MICEEIKNIRSSKSELRKFGIAMGIVFGLLGGLLLWRAKDSYPYFLFLSFLFMVPGLFIPQILKPIYTVWMSFAIIMGWFMTRMIVTTLFYLIFTPIGFMARSFGKDFFPRQFDQNSQSYWILKKKRTFDKKRYENQF